MIRIEESRNNVWFIYTNYILIESLDPVIKPYIIIKTYVSYERKYKSI